MPINQIDPKLLDILACPACDDRPPLMFDFANETLNCAECGRRYPIADGGIPVLLIDQATFAEEYETQSNADTN